MAHAQCSSEWQQEMRVNCLGFGVLAKMSRWAACIKHWWGFHGALMQNFVLNLIFLQLFRLFAWALLFLLNTFLGYKWSFILG